ncbi:hypothetical protein [Lactobacillus mulieris]|uniref:Protein CR006 P-loop domain-containing protein n=1 Tax=Lactobacillus mulieris TaxID=2508708 RepID=A0AAW5WY57_9LACO|nr:hypothetical protein [Lactobacillus mulieris]MCZ3622320.1 hypothetical protein [Lactobacillus mulieris]MCZ3622980.1 hypothetical protein [Lactobacillus mulieris]MCZ3636327.1 hypothetical protein [Lactobacillus mulieris]MCZ3690695.1 hypothetical protein [Lactobacillus mulieris]MCZ3696653.1 hypothetical protein [Lactobacillus mulieris]
MISEIHLPTDRFAAPKITGLKIKNMIWGKNGTGKTTISNCIKKEYDEEYDIRLFQGFEKIVGRDDKLDTIILGEKNNELNERIKEKKVVLKELENKRDELLDDSGDGLLPEEKEYNQKKKNLKK